MANGIDATVNDMEPAAFDPVIDRPAPHPAFAQLPPRHHAVLAPRQGRDQPIPIASVVFTPYIGVKSTFVGHGPELGARDVTAGLRV